MIDDLSRFEQHVLAKLAGQPGSTAKDLALRLGMGVVPTLAVLSSLRARGFVARRVEWEGQKLRDIQPARWFVVASEPEAIAA